MAKCTRPLAVVAVLIFLAATPSWPQEYEFRSGQWTATSAPAQGSAQGELSLVRHHVDRGQNRQAVSAAKRFLKFYDEPASREEVMMLAGEAQVKRGWLFQGYEWFEQQLGEFPDGRFSDRALDREMSVAESFLAGKKRVVWGVLRLPARDEGLDILSRIAEHAPGTPRAEQALMRIAEDRYARREWIESAEAYDRYLTAFTKGNRSGEAMLKGAQATHRSFKGIAHDETPLLEAEQRYRGFARQYPISAAESNVDTTLEQIRATRADKLLEEGRFYERIGKPQAAAFSYRLAMETYPQTDVAEQAGLALARLAPKLPPRPMAEPVPQPPEPTTQPASQPAPEEPIDLEALPGLAPSGERP